MPDLHRQAERDPLSESQEPSTLGERLESQAAWGEALMSVSEGLTSGKRWIWDEAARKVATLLSSPAAFQGEHFLQVTLSIPSLFHGVSSFLNSGTAVQLLQSKPERAGVDRIRQGLTWWFTLGLQNS